MQEEELVLRQLYGGAVQLSMPHRFQDVSDFRPVPDHQEVKQHTIYSRLMSHVHEASSLITGLD